MLNCSQAIIRLLLLIGIVLSPNAYSMPAFPGAEGFGAETVGGRGGVVFKVTNLNDSGAGSLRAAIDAEGPRIVVFEVSGIINLQSDLFIDSPNITIAGHSSPGGILVTGRRTIINTHDVIVRYMRFRIGSHNIDDAEKHDAVQIIGKYWGANTAYNIIFDHCSIGWGVDENMSLSGGVTATTVQWSIFAEGLRNAGHPKGQHSKGLMISGKYSFPNSITLHHNYLVHNQDRNPLIYSPADVSTIVDVVNNVVYNWKGGLAPLSAGSSHVNWVHNYAKPGNNSHAYSREVTHGASSVTPAPHLYVHGNIGSTRLTQTEPHWNVGVEWMDQDLSTLWQKITPWAVPEVNTAVMTGEYALQVLETVGAHIPVRDAADARVIDDFKNGTGSIIDNVSYPDDFPVFASPAPPTDSDNDGMPDNWEETQGLNPATNDSASDLDGDGYTNIEEYLHALVAENVNNSDLTSPPLAPGNLQIITTPQG